MQYESDIERAQAAIGEFNKLAPMLTSFARAFTGNPLIKVVPNIGATYTDGKFIYVEPPLKLADKIEHDLPMCNRHDGAMRALCEACGLREKILVNTFHEIAHNWAGSFEDVPEADKARAVTDAAQAIGIQVPQDILAEIRDATLHGAKITYDSIARTISPYLDILQNALEDARVNTKMGNARPGFDRMREGDEYEALYEGIKKIHPQTGEERILKFGDRDLDFQAAIGLYRKASGYEIPEDASPKVIEALSDARLDGICRAVATSQTVRGAYDGAVRALEVLREYGLLGGTKQDEPDSEPELPETPGIPSEEEADDQANEEEGDDGEQRDESDRGDAGEGSPDAEDSDGDSSDEGDEADDDDGSRDPAGGDSSSDRSDLDDEGSDEADAGQDGEGEGSQDADGSAPPPGGDDDDSAAESDNEADSEGADTADPDGGSEPGGSAGEEELPDGEEDSASGSSSDGEPDPGGEASDGLGEEVPDEDGGEGAADDAVDEQSDSGEGSDGEAGEQDAADAGDQDGRQEASDGGGDEDDGPSAGDRAADGSQPDCADAQGTPADGGDPTGGSQEGEPQGGSEGSTSSDGSGMDSGDDVGDPGSRGNGDDSTGSDAPDAAESRDGGSDEVGDDDGAGEREGAQLDGPLGDDATGTDEGDTEGGDGESESLDTGVDYQAAASQHGTHAVGGATEGEVNDGGEEVIEADSDPDADDGPIDGGEFNSDWVATAHDPAMRDDAPPMELLTPDEVAHEMQEFFGHDHERANADESEAAIQALVHVMHSSIFFDMVPRNVAGVRWHKFDKHVMDGAIDRAGAWTHEYYKRFRESRTALGIDGDFRAPESIIGAALSRARIAFANNARTKEMRNLKSGKVNGRVLGRRAPVKDPRLFAKKQRPGRRNYFVILGGDVSASTIGSSLVLIKRAIMAQAEVLARLGIPFEVIMHSADTANRGYDGYEVDMYLVKEAGEPWNDKARARLEEIGPDSNNLDGHTIQLYRKRLDARTETDRILMYYTDGKMPALNAGEEIQVLRRELNIFQKKNYKLLCVGVRTSSPEDWGLPTARVDEDKDLINVVKHLEGALVQ